MNLLTPQETAMMLNVCTKTLRQCRELGLRFVQITPSRVRYRKDDVLEYIEKRSICHSEQKPRHTGNTTSRSGVVDFMEAVEQRTMDKPKQ